MSGRLNAYRDAVIAEIDRILPDLRSCEAQFGRFDLGELEREMIRAPGVRLAILRGGLGQQPSGALDASLNVVAFIITEGKDRDTAGWAIAAAIGTLLHAGQLWGMTHLSAPSDAFIQPVISAAIRQRGVAIISVEWKQALRQLGDGLFGEGGAVRPELYLNDDPVEVDHG